ncbi:HAD-IA family hydrolase [Amaricoccus sp.]|uniref:HAD-IA family hydrolase n=1 Tax=Amaricoccus sp. TaxID=1872485 RepID=UPI001B42737A|nr:HAD-IA family hydrolase [Amaricoccus sp.]MBP7240806.1 HAD-IA family hydrolase [Amaricoccus sp.]
MARLVFDLDGTLVHSAPTMTVAANAMLAEIGRRPAPEATVLGFVGHGMRRLVERLLEVTGGVPEGGVEPHLAAYRRHYEADPVTGTSPYPGVPEALARLAADGHGIAVCTQKPDRPARAIIDGVGLGRHVAALTGGDSLPGVLKPDPRLFRHAADRLAPGPEIMIGDSATDAETARAAGAKFLLHTEGYNARRPETFGADGVFADYAELPGLVSAVLARA